MHGMRPPPHPTSANFISSSSSNRAAGWGGTSWLANPHPVASPSQGPRFLELSSQTGQGHEIRTTSNHIHASARFCQQARAPLCAVAVAWDELAHPAWSGLAVALAPGRAASAKLPSLPGCAGDQSVGNTHQGRDCCTSQHPDRREHACFVGSISNFQFVEAMAARPRLRTRAIPTTSIGGQGAFDYPRHAGSRPG